MTMIETVTNTRKAYDPQLDQEYGQAAEDVVIKWLRSRKAVQEVLRYPYGKKDIDLMIITELGDIFYADIERRENWKYGNFQYPTIHIPYRKRKFVERRIPFLYYAVRDDLGAMLKIAGRDIRRSIVVENGNKYQDEGEMFYSIDAIKAQFIRLNGYRR